MGDGFGFQRGIRFYEPFDTPDPPVISYFRISWGCLTIGLGWKFPCQFMWMNFKVLILTKQIMWASITIILCTEHPLALGYKDWALDECLLPLHRGSENLHLAMECQSSSIRLTWFFLWVLKRPFELVSSLTSSLLPQTVSEPMRLQLEKRELISFGLFSSFQSPWPRDRMACRAQGGLWHCHLRIKRPGLS